MFYSYHGIHDEEKILGNEYELTADIQFDEEKEVIHSIQQTINYVDIYQLIQQRMSVPSPLLETVIMDIGTSIKKKYDTEYQKLFFRHSINFLNFYLYEKDPIEIREKVKK